VILADLRVVTYRHSRHSPHAGYDGLARYAAGTLRARPIPRLVLPKRFMSRLAGGVLAYDWESLATELRAGADLLAHRGCTYHVLYGEKTYQYLGLLEGVRRNRVVATFHLPIRAHRQVLRSERHLRRLSAVVCVGRNQMDYFASVVGAERTFFVPHGVDAAHFLPPEDFAARAADRYLFVGEHLRDCVTLRGALTRIAAALPHTRCVAVTGNAEVSRYDTDAGVLRRPDVPEAELLRLYRSSALLLLPLVDTVASNTVLEALACGLPIVTTDVGAIRDYVTPECAILVPPGDAAALAAAAVALLNDPARRRAMALAARRQALAFAWPEIVRQLRVVYDSVR
jgi:glycosyltransferase involved in cell wall biosynthesis